MAEAAAAAGPAHVAARNKADLVETCEVGCTAFRLGFAASTNLSLWVARECGAGGRCRLGSVLRG